MAKKKQKMYKTRANQRFMTSKEYKKYLSLRKHWKWGYDHNIGSPSYSAYFEYRQKGGKKTFTEFKKSDRENFINSQLPFKYQRKS